MILVNHHAIWPPIPKRFFARVWQDTQHPSTSPLPGAAAHARGGSNFLYVGSTGFAHLPSFAEDMHAGSVRDTTPVVQAKCSSVVFPEIEQHGERHV